MRKIVLIALMLCILAISPIGNAQAFELNTSEWRNYATINKVVLYYSPSSIKVNGDKARAMVCYHYTVSDTYRIVCKEYTKGSNTVDIIKTIDYYSDGSFKQGSTKRIANVSMDVNEGMITREMW